MDLTYARFHTQTTGTAGDANASIAQAATASGGGYVSLSQRKVRNAAQSFKATARQPRRLWYNSFRLETPHDKTKYYLSAQRVESPWLVEQTWASDGRLPDDTAVRCCGEAAVIYATPTSDIYKVSPTDKEGGLQVHVLYWEDHNADLLTVKLKCQELIERACKHKTYWGMGPRDIQHTTVLISAFDMPYEAQVCFSVTNWQDVTDKTIMDPQCCVMLEVSSANRAPTPNSNQSHLAQFQPYDVGFVRPEAIHGHASIRSGWACLHYDGMDAFVTAPADSTGPVVTERVTTDNFDQLFGRCKKTLLSYNEYEGPFTFTRRTTQPKWSGLGDGYAYYDSSSTAADASRLLAGTSCKYTVCKEDGALNLVYTNTESVVNTIPINGDKPAEDLVNQLRALTTAQGQSLEPTVSSKPQQNVKVAKTTIKQNKNPVDENAKGTHKPCGLTGEYKAATHGPSLCAALIAAPNVYLRKPPKPNPTDLVGIDSSSYEGGITRDAIRTQLRASVGGGGAALPMTDKMKYFDLLGDHTADANMDVEYLHNHESNQTLLASVGILTLSEAHASAAIAKTKLTVAAATVPRIVALLLNKNVLVYTLDETKSAPTLTSAYFDAAGRGARNPEKQTGVDAADCDGYALAINDSKFSGLGFLMHQSEFATLFLRESRGADGKPAVTNLFRLYYGDGKPLGAERMQECFRESYAPDVHWRLPRDKLVYSA